MASDNPVTQNKFVTYIEAHPLLVAGGVIILGLLIGFARSKKQAAAATPATTTPTTLNSGINPLTGAPYASQATTYASGSNIGALFNGGTAAGSYNGGINPATGQPYYNNSGLINPYTGQAVAYVPTGTNFTTNNVGAQINGTPGNVTVNATNSITPNSPTTINQTRFVAPTPPIAPATPVVNNPAPLPTTPTVVASPTPVMQPAVTPPPQKSMLWSGSYTVRGGDTLSGIASMVTNNLRAQGAPTTSVVTYQQIYSNNQGVIDSTAKAHGNPIPGGPWNNIFPGETIRIPTWA